MRPPQKIAVGILGVFLISLVVGWVLSQHEYVADRGAANDVSTARTRGFAGDVWVGRVAATMVDSAPSTEALGRGDNDAGAASATTVDSSRVTPTSKAPPTSKAEVSTGQRRKDTPPFIAVDMAGPVVAWQPSHQDDTGNDSWHEYRICGDIVARTMALLPDVGNVLAWETGMGLTGSNNNGGTNRPAFDSELARANEAEADYFISIHNDGGAPSGVLGMYFVGDEASAEVAERFARAVSLATSLPYRGLRGHDLYSLDPKRNGAPVRILLEIGDNAQDRAFLEDPDARQKIAVSLAAAVRSLEASQ